MLERGKEKKVPRMVYRVPRNLPTWKIGLQKHIQLQTSCQITKTKKEKKKANALQI
jgi:hypothetical protein